MNNNNHHHQNLLSLSQNSNTLDVMRSSPSNSISNEIGNSQFYIDSNCKLKFERNLIKHLYFSRTLRSKT
jgi:hypothetical protein